MLSFLLRCNRRLNNTPPSCCACTCRSYIQDFLPQYAADNSWLRIKVIARAHKAPTLTAEYRDGTAKTVDVKKRPPNQVAAMAKGLCDSTTATIRHLARPVVTPRPSVQGVWSPDMAFTTFTLREVHGQGEAAPEGASALR